MMDVLNAIFKGKAEWYSQRDANRRATSLTFKCSTKTPVMSVADVLLEHASSAAEMVVRQAVKLYQGHHHVAVDDRLLQLDPITCCIKCGHETTLVDDEHMNAEQLFAHAERQSVKWMERAHRLRPAAATR